jgi:hypothetical protein
MELSVSVSVDDMEDLVAGLPDDASSEARVVDLASAYLRHTFENEVLYRTVVRHYMDTWLAAEAAGEGHEQPVREGRRRRWIDTALGPRGAMSSKERKRLETALCLVIGSEAFLTLRDVCQLDEDEAVAVSRWAVSALVAAAGSH